jgi:TolB-like protein/tetratricopeptide (TPR) repeat protein
MHSTRYDVWMATTGVSIAVMPFRNLSPETDSDYFANGFVDDLTGDLTRFSSLRVLAAESTFALEQSDRSIDDVATQWDLDFILTGSLRRGDAKLRVGVQLTRVQGRETVWAERFDAPFEKVFDIQDEIAATVAGRLAVHVDEATLDGARRQSVENLPAYECWLRGMDCLKRGTLEGDEESRPLFQQALQIDSHYARAYCGLSLSHFNEWTCHAWHLWDESEQNAFDYASQAVRYDDRDAMVHSVLARVYRFRRQHRQADQHAERALELNPNDAHVLIQVAIVKLFGGEPADGCELAHKAIALNPLHLDWYHGVVGWSLFMLRKYDEASHHLERAGDMLTNFPAYRAACAAIAGDLDRARSEYGLFLREYRDKIAFGREPQEGEALKWSVQVSPFRHLEDSQRMPDALRDAGIAEIDVADALSSRETTLVRPAVIARPAGNEFRCEDGVWSIAYEGAGARLRGLKGFHDIARLLAQPNEPLHCLELSGSAVVNDAADEVLDQQARRQYRQRIEELQEELEQAEADNDPARAEPARIELDAVIDELGRATGLRGRTRKMGDAAERARSAVTWRVRSAIKKILAAHPRLGQHLSNSIRTGNFCVFSPEIATEWEL